MKRVLVLVLAALAAGAFAQSRSSFTIASAFGGFTHVVTNAGLTHTLTLSPSPTITLGASTFSVTAVFGFWSLSNDDDLVATKSPIGTWDPHSNNAGAGGIAGWKTNPPNSILPGETFSWTYGSLNVASVELIGYHVRIDGTWPGTTGDTGYTAVPEPGTMAVLGLGLAAILRRRRARGQGWAFGLTSPDHPLGDRWQAGRRALRPAS
jgi:hypothetical protein